MHIERIRIDRVFDAQPRSGDFSFDTGGRAVYGVRLPGGAIPREGATLALAFRRPGDWSSLAGWRDLDSHEVVLDDPWWRLAWGWDDVLMLLVPLLLFGALILAGPGGAMAVLLAIAGAAVYSVLRVRRHVLRVRLALSGLAPA